MSGEGASLVPVGGQDGDDQKGGGLKETLLIALSMGGYLALSVGSFIAGTAYWGRSALQEPVYMSDEPGICLAVALIFTTIMALPTGKKIFGLGSAAAAAIVSGFMGSVATFTLPPAATPALSAEREICPDHQGQGAFRVSNRQGRTMIIDCGPRPAGPQ